MEEKVAVFAPLRQMSLISVSIQTLTSSQSCIVCTCSGGMRMPKSLLSCDSSVHQAIVVSII